MESITTLSPPPPPSLTPSLANDLLTAWDLLSRLGVWTIGWVYSLSTRLIAFLTLTLPTQLFNLLHFSASLTFHLTFLKVLGFLLVVSTGLSYVWKVRYLNRYTELRDLPGGNRIKGDEGFDLHPDLATDQTSSGFHNYLDEFLSAIKVFGYLEKPVFHELARHLQTRRLVAGDTLDLAQDKSFYIVVDGKVEVYANTAGEGAGQEDFVDVEGEPEGAEERGWQLLNCVESGGTLSSLFTILSLFTEDVKLRYEEDEGASADEGGRRDGDVSRFDLNDAAPSAGRRPVRPHFPGYTRNNSHRIGEEPEGEGEDADESSLAEDAQQAGDSTAEDDNDDDDRDTEVLTLSPSEDPIAPSDSRSNATTPSVIRSPATSEAGFFPPPVPSAATLSSSSSRPAALSQPPRRSTTLSTSSSTTSRRPPLLPHPSRRSTRGAAHQPRRKSTGGGGGGGSDGAGLGRKQEATVARAATDTTLAVIPAEAFRRLTKKFPNAAAGRSSRWLCKQSKAN